MNIQHLADALQRKVILTPTSPSSSAPASSPPEAAASTQTDAIAQATRLKDAQPSTPAASFAKLQRPASLRAPASATQSTPQPSTLSPIVTRQLRDLRVLTRAELARPQLIVAMGRFFAREHAKITQAMPEAAANRPLFLLEDARGRLANVQGNKEKCEASPLNLGAVAATLDALELELSEASKKRVYGDFNYYPSALSITPNGEIISNPDHRNTNWHAVYEILNRHVFTSRLSHEDLTMLADAYTHEAHSRRVTHQELIHFGQAKYVFDILYHLYFVDIAFDCPNTGSEAKIAQARSLEQAELMLERIEADWQWLHARGVELEPLLSTGKDA